MRAIVIDITLFRAPVRVILSVFISYIILERYSSYVKDKSTIAATLINKIFYYNIGVHITLLLIILNTGSLYLLYYTPVIMKRVNVEGGLES